MRPRTLALPIALACALGSLVIAAACEDPDQHVYAAATYDPINDCLDAYAPIDVVSGGGGDNTCPPICLVGGDGTVYISDVCPPYPVAFDTSGDNALCQPAFAAFTRNDVCNPDGGSSNPLPVDSGTTPAVDAPDDVTTDDDATDASG